MDFWHNTQPRLCIVVEMILPAPEIGTDAPYVFVEITMLNIHVHLAVHLLAKCTFGEGRKAHQVLLIFDGLSTFVASTVAKCLKLSHGTGKVAEVLEWKRELVEQC